MDTATTSPVFGPPIIPAAIEPIDRPLAVALVFDVSASMYGDKRVIDLFKESLVSRFSNMEFDNIFYLGGEWYEDPGSAVAAICNYTIPVRNFSLAINDAVKSLSTLDRFYRRRLLLVTDSFSIRDCLAMSVPVNRNASHLLDISLHAAGYGPQYSRSIAECGWDFYHLDEPVEIDPILTKVCK